MRKILFVCQKGIDRSPTAYDVCKVLAGVLKKRVIAGYMGIDSGIILGDLRDNGRKSARDYQVYVMEESMKRTMQARYKADKRNIFCLDIPNRYTRGESELRRVLESKIFDILLK